MLVSEAIAAVQAITGKAATTSTLVRWLSEFDGKLAFETYRVPEWRPYDPTDDQSTELLIPYPWDGVYVHHLEAMTYYTNGEYDRYENARTMTERALSEFKAYLMRTQSTPCVPGYPTDKTGGTGDQVEEETIEDQEE